ncbi:MAG: co-chaperone GroES [Dehalococcoidia bacterium]|nr:co-chaperone GroES [Dehalococcoidia bacterium]
MPRTLVPIADRILLKPLKEKHQTSSGLLLPETAPEKALLEGEVVAVGPGRLTSEGVRVPMSLKPGDHVLYADVASMPITENGIDYLLLGEPSIIAKVAGAAAKR